MQHTAHRQSANCIGDFQTVDYDDFRLVQLDRRTDFQIVERHRREGGRALLSEFRKVFREPIRDAWPCSIRSKSARAVSLFGCYYVIHEFTYFKLYKPNRVS